MGPELHDKLPLYPVSEIEKDSQNEVIYQELGNEDSSTSNANNAKIELYPGSGQFIASSRGSRKPATTGQGEYSLNFDDADLGEVAKVILSDILNENYVLSPKVAGKVTLQTSQPLSRSELLPTLDMLLNINNAGMVFQNGVFQIKPKTEAIVNSAFSSYNKFRQQIPAGYQIKVVPVKNVAVTELAEIIKPLMQEKSLLHVDNNRNMMLIAGTGAELARAMEMVNAFDVDVMKGRSFGLFPLQNVDSTKMIEELEQVFNKKAAADSGFFQFMAIERLNAILAITQQAKYLKDIERWVIRLDRANTSAGGGVIVYRAQHVDAVKLAETLNNIFSSSKKSSAGSSVASGRKVVQVTNKEKAKTKTTTSRKLKSATSIADIGDVSIIADEVNNALIIVATAQDYAVVQRVIKQLDVMPLQVLIDATIVDVTLTDNLEYGIKWFFEHGSGGVNAINSGGIDLTSTASSLALAGAKKRLSSAAGFGYGFISKSGDIKAVLNAEATKNNINIISSPSVMVLNNQEAKIQVGEERSLRTSESTNTSSSSSDPIVTSTIQQRKTGVTVTVKPRVNANGLVIMDIEQSVEDFADGSTNGNPDILTRELKSNVAIQSGETIVLGGLISEKTTNGKDGIPLLHEIPLVGPLFGNTEKTKRKTELVILITPRVVKSKLDARLVTNEFKRKLSGIYEEVPVEINKPQPAVINANDS